MKVAHQNAPVAALPGSQSGGFFSGLVQAVSASNAPAVGSLSPGSATGRPTPTRSSVRPQAGGGLDGWLVDRLFGR
jgi:penicillin-binding protein 1A